MSIEITENRQRHTIGPAETVLQRILTTAPGRLCVTSYFSSNRPLAQYWRNTETSQRLSMVFRCRIVAICSIR